MIVINKERAKAKIRKAINTCPTDCKLQRKKLDKFNQPSGEFQNLSNFTGYFQVTTTRQKYKVTHNGVLPVAPAINLMVIIDEDTKIIRKGDFIRANEELYKVIDFVDMNKLGIYYDIVLEEQ